jgi:transcriptional regulator with XRE-family HTH domain
VSKEICVKIGRRIRKLRIERGWTQTMLVDHADLAREHLSELENGKKEIGVLALARITQALGVTLQKFFEGF